MLMFAPVYLDKSFEAELDYGGNVAFPTNLLWGTLSWDEEFRSSCTAPCTKKHEKYENMSVVSSDSAGASPQHRQPKADAYLM